MIFSVNFFRLSKWFNTNETYFTKMINYFYNFSKEQRLQFDVTLQFFFLTFFYLSMAIATFDDDQEELVEFLVKLLFYLFLYTFLYLIYKYSIHFLPFSEAAKGKNRRASMVVQFIQDIIDMVGFILRFGSLIVRLNIYDGVEDVFDSYFIVITDFDEDEYFSELFYSPYSNMFFDIDNHDDRSFFLEDELDFSGDFFSLYFLIWGKFVFFLILAVEGVARIVIALYVTYLIVFEVHSLNRSFSEDVFFLSKRVPLRY